MKIVFLTSKKIEELMKKEISEFFNKYDIDIISYDVDVASFIKTKDIIDRINKNYDFAIVPGNFIGNCRVIEKFLNEKGIKTRVIRGTRNLGDVKIFLKNLEKLNNDEIEKLHDFPADEILIEKIKENLKEELKEIDSGNFKFKIRDVPLNGIPKVIGEIGNAPLLDDKKIKEKVKKFMEEGARIISIGMMPEERTDEIKRIVKAIKEISDVPLCIDSLNENEILEGIRNGVDLVMSICEKNLKIVEEINIPVVVIPADEKARIVKYNERIIFLENLMRKIKNLNENIKIIVDPILDPVN
ncbi:MAG: dihydropteroate synthase, partial [Candidatus Altarchaeaceae archaeon]